MEQSGVKLGVVIVAGGSGTRMGGVTPKQFLFLGQLPILAHSINHFAATYPSCDIVVVLPLSHLEYWTNLAARLPIAPHKTTTGGKERFHSVKAGIDLLSQSVDIIAIHDGARPLISHALIQRCVEQALSHGSAIPAIKLVDSVRVIGEGEESSYFSRESLRAVQTPQTFDAVTIRRAYTGEWQESFTDDASVVERCGERVFLCQGEVQNIKITTTEDLIYAQAIIDNQQREEENEPTQI